MKKHILLVDDDDDELKIFTDAIREIPGEFLCSFARDSDSALALLKSFMPHYIFVDFNIPKVNGLEFLSLVKHNIAFRDIKVFLYSTRISDEINKMAEVLGAAGSLEKTYSIRALSSELQAILSDDSKPDYVLFNAK